MYERAGGEAFFETLTDRFYAGVASDPVLRPLYPSDAARSKPPASSEALPHPALGRPAGVPIRAGRSPPWSPSRRFLIGPGRSNAWCAHARSGRASGPPVARREPDARVSSRRPPTSWSTRPDPTLPWQAAAHPRPVEGPRRPAPAGIPHGAAEGDQVTRRARSTGSVLESDGQEAAHRESGAEDPDGAPSTRMTMPVSMRLVRRSRTAGGSRAASRCRRTTRWCPGTVAHPEGEHGPEHALDQALPA